MPVLIVDRVGRAGGHVGKIVIANRAIHHEPCTFVNENSAL